MKNLIRLINLPRNINEITVTSDGHYLGQIEGDLGYNAFFGKPSFHKGPGRDMSIKTWKSFTFNQRKEVIRDSRIIGIEIRNFLPK